MSIGRKLKMGMVGGGPGAFIGDIHRKAAALDGLIETVCGCFSSDPAKSKETGRQLYLPENRIYGTFEEMIEKESSLPTDEKMDFIAIATPNYLHFQPAMLALRHGFHVVCDKPMTISVDEALQLVQEVKKSGLLFCLTHNYTGYPLVKEARERVINNELGNIRKIVAEYPQGWLAEKLEETGNKQAGWRADPAKSGVGGALGDIGTHAANLAEYISGLKINEVFADLSSFVSGRKLDDDCNLLVRFNNGARGVIYASQISVGEENGLKIRVYGEKASLTWVQLEPNSLLISYNDKPSQLLKPGLGKGYLSKNINHYTRLPGGHPEGFIEAFANIYKAFATDLLCYKSKIATPTWVDYPTVEDGLHGMKFMEAVVASSSEKKWVSI